MVSDLNGKKKWKSRFLDPTKDICLCKKSDDTTLIKHLDGTNAEAHANTIVNGLHRYTLCIPGRKPPNPVRNLESGAQKAKRAIPTLHSKLWRCLTVSIARHLHLNWEPTDTTSRTRNDVEIVYLILPEGLLQSVQPVGWPVRCKMSTNLIRTPFKPGTMVLNTLSFESTKRVYELLPECASKGAAVQKLFMHDMTLLFIEILYSRLICKCRSTGIRCLAV